MTDRQKPWRLLYGDGTTRHFTNEADCRQVAPQLAAQIDDVVLIEHFEDNDWWMVDKVGTPVRRDYHSPSPIVLGDFVHTDHYDYEGRVYMIHPYGCPEDDGWLAGQQIPVAHFKNERWVSILVHGGGAVVAPMALVTKIEPFAPFHNPSAHLYFGDR